MRILLSLLFLPLFLLAAPPKAVVFDYGGVVAKVDRKPVLEYLSESLEISYKKVKSDFRGDKLYSAFEKPLSYWEEYAKKPLSSLWMQQFELHKKAILTEIAGMRDLIENLKEKGIHIIVLSNTSPNRARFIEKMGGYDSFDTILLSCYLGVSKPDLKIFDSLLQHIAYKAEECVFIDNKTANVKAAEKVGIDSIHFESVEQLLEEFKKRELAL